MKKTKSILLLFAIIATGLTVFSCSDDSDEVDPCENISCLNGGTCEDGTCDCPEGFSGTNCAEEDLCFTQNIECLNGGTCVDGSCDCPEGYLGDRCEQVDVTKVQVLLDLGITPKVLFDSGVPLDSFYGKLYQGGLIYYMNTATGNGLVASTPVSISAEWGCWQSQINGADGSGVGDGQQNTIDILSGCAESGIAARGCDQLELNGQSDWFMPSKDELRLMHENLHLNGFGDFQAGGQYWSSTESTMFNRAWFQFFSLFAGNQNEGPKDAPRRVRPTRSF